MDQHWRSETYSPGRIVTCRPCADQGRHRHVIGKWYQGGRCHFATVKDSECGKSGCRQTCRAECRTVTAGGWGIVRATAIRTQLLPECDPSSAYPPHSGGNLKRHSSRHGGTAQCAVCSPRQNGTAAEIDHVRTDRQLRPG